MRRQILVCGLLWAALVGGNAWSTGKGENEWTRICPPPPSNYLKTANERPCLLMNVVAYTRENPDNVYMSGITVMHDGYPYKGYTVHIVGPIGDALSHSADILLQVDSNPPHQGRPVFVGGRADFDENEQILGELSQGKMAHIEFTDIYTLERYKKDILLSGFAPLYAEFVETNGVTKFGE